MAEFVAMGLSVATVHVIEKGIETIFDKYRGRKEEETRKVMECKIGEDFLELKGKMEALQESFRKLQESRQCVCQLLRTELEKTQGKKEGNFARVLLSIMENEIQMVSQRVQTLEEDVQKWPEDTKFELQLIRAYLEKTHGKKEEAISKVLESRICEKYQKLFKIIESVGKDLQNSLESAQHELQLLREGLEK